MRKYPIIFILLLICVSCSNTPEPVAMEPPAVVVSATQPTVQDLPIYIESIGSLHPSILLEVRPLSSGTITHISAIEGQKVQKHTPLFEIDRRPYAAKLQEIEAQLSIDQTHLEATQKKLSRYRNLASKDLIAQAEWDELETQSKIAEGTVKLNQSRLEMAKLDLEHCTVKAPVEGQLGKIDIYPGHIANGPQTLLATIAKLDPLIVEYTINEKEYFEMPDGNMSVEISPLCHPEIVKNGTMTFFDHHFDQKNGMLLIHGKISNEDELFHPGQSVKVRILTRTQNQALLIPQKAIKYNQQGAYVYVIQPDMTVTLRPVVLGDEHKHDQIVLKGLDPSEKIITEGHLRLWPGIKVEIKS